MSWLKPKVLLLKKSHNISKHYWRHDAKIICAKECNVLIWIITKEIMHFLSTCENGGRGLFKRNVWWSAKNLENKMTLETNGFL